MSERALHGKGIYGKETHIKETHGKGMLYTCDLICYGVASPVAFRDYISMLEKHSRKKVKQYIHRGNGLKTGEPEKVIYEDGTIEQGTSETKLWSRLWYHYLVRESCYNCIFHSLVRPGNVTIGDFWGIEKVLLGFKDEWGASCILVNDSRGLALLDAVGENLDLRQVLVADVANKAQPMLFEQPRGDRQEQFWKAYSKGGFEGACNELGFIGKKRFFKEPQRKAKAAVQMLLSTLKVEDAGKGESGQVSEQRNKTLDCFPLAFAAKHSGEKIRKQSSSGGVFYALAQSILNLGGIVYGCAFDENHKAHHVRCETIGEVVCCMGSKYTQSDLGCILDNVKQDINAGRDVLFTGTPCQVAAVRAVCEELETHNGFGGVGVNGALSTCIDLKPSSVPRAIGLESVGILDGAIMKLPNIPNAAPRRSSNTSAAVVPKLFSSPKECCGCSACVALCPQGAIEMKADAKGFWYPIINEDVCIGCMKCANACEFKAYQTASARNYK